MEKFNAIYEEVDGGWIGYVEELPGANTQGKTKEEVRENLKEAIQLIIEANRELAREELKGRNFVREELVVAV
jgi:predicted RNase H-like HicB family nuclease